ncbi:MAG: hypothetical protein AAF399_23800 [Bacteroidota bacterium]
MKPYFLTMVLILFLGAQAQAQKTKKSTGEYQLNLTESTFSEAEACQQCKELAMIEAIEKAFGRVILQGNSTIIENTYTGETTETTQIFNMIAETYVNGDWLKTIDESCERFTESGEFWIRCKVKGQVQELVQPKLDLQVYTLDCEEPSCQTSEFRDGESFFVRAKSPVDGYLTVYLADDAVAQRLLPYRNMPRKLINGVKIKGDQDYVLFSQAKDELDLRSYVDEYEMYAVSSVDHNRLYVIFSEKPLVKPALSQSEIEEQQEMPMELDAQAFRRWLAQQRQYNPDIQVARLDVTIRQ